MVSSSTPNRSSDSPARQPPLELPAESISRPSSLSLRPQLGIQTRIRARSITAGAGTSAPTLPFLSPTLVGSPTLSSLPAGFDSSVLPGRSGLSRERRASVGRDDRDADDEGEHERLPSTEEGGSTESESPPPTPRDDHPSIPSFRVSGEGGHWSEEAQLNLGGVSPALRTKERRRAEVALEGATSHRVRRGRSFTSLLVPQVGQANYDREDTIAEVITPPPSDIETGDIPYGPTLSTFPPTTSSTLTPSGPPKALRDFIPQIGLLLFLFLSSFAVIAGLVATLPGLHIPHAVADLPELTAALSTYRASSYLAEVHLFTVLTALFLWKQCFSIPGSILTNVLFGALYGTTAGCWWACLWTASGSTGAYGIARVISPLVEHYFSTPLAVTRRTLKLPHPDQPQLAGPALSSSDLFSHLLLARFFPLLPYSVLNIISGVLRLPLTIFFSTLFLGSFPFNFVTVSIGSVVALAAADPSSGISNKIWTPAVLQKLVLVTIVSVVPVFFKKQLQAFLGSAAVANFFSGAPMHVVRFGSRIKNGVVRRIFGEGIVAPASATSMAAVAAARRKGEWRRKWNRSWGGEGVRLERSSFGEESGEEGRHVMSGWDEEGGEEGPLLG